jgi:hypothetical protein
MADLPIPNNFHFIFGLQKQKEPFHLSHYLCLRSCLEVNRPDSVYFYYHYEPYGRYWDLIKNDLTLVKVALTPFVSGYRYGFRNRACKKYSYAHHSDFIRLEKLVERGGIYADIDTIFVNKVPDNLRSKPFVLGREADVLCQQTHRMRSSLCNAFIMSAKGAFFAREWLGAMEGAFNGSWSNHSTFLPQSLSERYPEHIHIEPAQTFYKHMWTREGIYTLLQGCDRDYEGVVSMHLWSHLWWSRRRRDFSDFHQEMLTEAYIRAVDTTYNLVARRFLP